MGGRHLVHGDTEAAVTAAFDEFLGASTRRRPTVSAAWYAPARATASTMVCRRDRHTTRARQLDDNVMAIRHRRDAGPATA